MVRRFCQVAVLLLCFLGQTTALQRKPRTSLEKPAGSETMLPTKNKQHELNHGSMQMCGGDPHVWGSVLGSVWGFLSETCHSGTHMSPLHLRTAMSQHQHHQQLVVVLTLMLMSLNCVAVAAAAAAPTPLGAPVATAN